MFHKFYDKHSDSRMDRVSHREDKKYPYYGICALIIKFMY